MSYQLPPNLLRLFQPRPPLTFASSSKVDRDPRYVPKKTVRPMQGVGTFLEQIKQSAADAGQATEGDEEGADGKDEEGRQLTHTALTKREMAMEAEKAQREETKAQRTASYDPNSNPDAQGDPFTTLFISRLDYSVTETDLHREFEKFGPVERIRLVCDKKGKSRGYAFIVFERERDMRTAYKEAEGMKLKGRRAMVDVERGRTVKDWKPMRLGGGLGGLSRKKKEPAPVIDSFGGGMRGAFGGGGGGRGGRGGYRGGFGGGGRFGGPPMGAGGYRGPPSGYDSGGGYGRFDGPPPAKRGRF